MGDAHRAHPIGLRGYAPGRRSANQRFVLFERMKPEGGALDGGAQNGHRRVALRVLECGNAASSGFTSSAVLATYTVKLISAPPRMLLPLFPIGNKSESAKKLPRL